MSFIVYYIKGIYWVLYFSMIGINCMGTILYRYIGKVIIGKFIVNLWYFARVIFVGIGKYGYFKSPTNP